MSVPRLKTGEKLSFQIAPSSKLLLQQMVLKYESRHTPRSQQFVAMSEIDLR